MKTKQDIFRNRNNNAFNFQKWFSTCINRLPWMKIIHAPASVHCFPIVFHKNSAKNTEAKEQKKERVTKWTKTLINAQNLNASYLALQSSLLLSDSRALVLVSCSCQSCNKQLSPVQSICLLSGKRRSFDKTVDWPKVMYNSFAFSSFPCSENNIHTWRAVGPQRRNWN